MSNNVGSASSSQGVPAGTSSANPAARPSSGSGSGFENLGSQPYNANPPANPDAISFSGGGRTLQGAGMSRINPNVDPGPAGEQGPLRQRLVQQYNHELANGASSSQAAQDAESTFSPWEEPNLDSGRYLQNLIAAQGNQGPLHDDPAVGNAGAVQNDDPEEAQPNGGDAQAAGQQPAGAEQQPESSGNDANGGAESSSGPSGSSASGSGTTLNDAQQSSAVRDYNHFRATGQSSTSAAHSAAQNAGTALGAATISYLLNQIHSQGSHTELRH